MQYNTRIVNQKHGNFRNTNEKKFNYDRDTFFLN